MHVHVVGNVCVDTTFRLEHFPVPGETLNATDHSDGVGGKGANQAIAAARTDAAVHLWSVVGNDAAAVRLGDQLLADLAAVTLVTKTLPTDRSTILLDAAGENMIVTGSLCAQAFDPISETQLLARIETGDIVVMQGNLRAETTSACLREAGSRGALTILNPSPLTRGIPPELAAVDIVVVNEGEAKSITGQSTPELAARELIALGAAAAVVTLGARGCLIIESGASTHLAAPQVEVVDTSGAGDVFCGVLIGCLGRGMALTRSATVAVRAAALSVGREGTSSSCPTRQEIIDLIKTMETETA